MSAAGPERRLLAATAKSLFTIVSVTALGSTLMT